MNEYSQPDFYRFNSDSLQLIQWIKTQVQGARGLLDLGAGCGVMGLELAMYYHPERLELVEAQAEFGTHLDQNVSRAQLPKTQVKIVRERFLNYRTSQKFDLIVCNPPYYLPGHGKASLDPRRQMARSFIMDGWSELFHCIETSLHPKGHAFIVYKDEGPLRKVVDELLGEVALNFSSHREGSLVFLKLSGLNVN